MLISKNILSIIINYSKPLTIDNLSINKQNFFGICLKCKSRIKYCPVCWLYFSIVYEMMYGNRYIPNYQFDKIIKYYTIKTFIKNINFRTYYLQDENLFLIKLLLFIPPNDTRNFFANYKKLFFIFSIMNNIFYNN
tara:strand:+ start:1086 stop:1493 length:408 start_codon:yes stop_codon:yes gene_type:complete